MARPTIAELEAILEQEEEVEIEILPNGEVRARGETSAQELGGPLDDSRRPVTRVISPSVYRPRLHCRSFLYDI